MTVEGGQDVRRGGQPPSAALTLQLVQRLAGLGQRLRHRRPVGHPAIYGLGQLHQAGAENIFPDDADVLLHVGRRGSQLHQAEEILPGYWRAHLGSLIKDSHWVDRAARPLQGQHGFIDGPVRGQAEVGGPQ